MYAQTNFFGENCDVKKGEGVQLVFIFLVTNKKNDKFLLNILKKTSTGTTRDVGTNRTEYMSHGHNIENSLFAGHTTFNHNVMPILLLTKMSNTQVAGNIEVGYRYYYICKNAMV